MRLVLLTLGAQMADLAASTLAARHVGIGGESNPMFAALWATPALFVAVKAAGAIALALLALHVPRRLALLPAIAGLVGAGTALVALA